MNFQDYIKTELLILIPVLYFVGIGLKKSMLPDKWIPATLGGIGIGMAAMWILATVDISGIKEVAAALFTAVTQGVLLTGTSVYANQLYVQAKKDK